METAEHGLTNTRKRWMSCIAYVALPCWSPGRSVSGTRPWSGVRISAVFFVAFRTVRGQILGHGKRQLQESVKNVVHHCQPTCSTKRHDGAMVKSPRSGAMKSHQSPWCAHNRAALRTTLDVQRFEIPGAASAAATAP